MSEWSLCDTLEEQLYALELEKNLSTVSILHCKLSPLHIDCWKASGRYISIIVKKIDLWVLWDYDAEDRISVFLKCKPTLTSLNSWSDQADRDSKSHTVHIILPTEAPNVQQFYSSGIWGAERLGEDLLHLHSQWKSWNLSPGSLIVNPALASSLLSKLGRLTVCLWKPVLTSGLFPKREMKHELIFKESESGGKSSNWAHSFLLFHGHLKTLAGCWGVGRSSHFPVFFFSQLQNSESWTAVLWVHCSLCHDQPLL